MRWFWIDRFEEFRSGDRAVAIKNVTLAEEHLWDQAGGVPFMPPTLILEGMAQTAGMLMGEMFGFRMRLVLAKVSSVKFHFPVRPGDTLRYSASLQRWSDVGGRIATTSHVGDRLQAAGDFFLAVLPEGQMAEHLFEPAQLARLVRLFRIFEVGRTKEGAPLKMPPELLEAERQEADLS